MDRLIHRNIDNHKEWLVDLGGSSNSKATWIAMLLHPPKTHRGIITWSTGKNRRKNEITQDLQLVANRGWLVYIFPIRSVEVSNHNSRAELEIELGTSHYSCGFTIGIKIIGLEK